MSLLSAQEWCLLLIFVVFACASDLREICSIDLDLAVLKRRLEQRSPKKKSSYEAQHDKALDAVFKEVWKKVDFGDVSAEVALSREDVERFRSLDREAAPEGHRTNFGKDWRTKGPDKCISSTLDHYSPLVVFKHLVASDARNGDTFVDIGSGVGRVLVSAVLFNDATTAVGIELSHQRAELSCDAIRRLQQLLAEANATKLPCGYYCKLQVEKQIGDIRNIKVFAGDARNYNFSGASRIFSYANCMPASVLAALRNNILSEASPGTQVWVTNPHGFSDGNVRRMGGKRFVVLADPFRLVVAAARNEL